MNRVRKQVTETVNKSSRTNGIAKLVRNKGNLSRNLRDMVQWATSGGKGAKGNTLRDA